MQTIKELIIQIEAIRSSTVISFITDSRVLIESKDCLMLADNLDMISDNGLVKINRLDLILQSHGGLVEAAYKFVDLCKEYANEFNVIIPYAAKSAATIIALGANNIIMTPVSELGPVDPIIQHPENPNIRIPAKSIKDYFRLVEGGTNENLFISPELKNLISKKLDPYLLGSYQSAMQSSREIVTKLLKENEFREKLDLLKSVVDEFTEIHSSHSFPITRNRLIELGFSNITKSEENYQLHKTIKILFNTYMTFMRKNNAIRLHGNREQNMTEQITIPKTNQEITPPISFG